MLYFQSSALRGVVSMVDERVALFSPVCRYDLARWTGVTMRITGALVIYCVIDKARSPPAARFIFTGFTVLISMISVLLRHRPARACITDFLHVNRNPATSL